MLVIAGPCRPLEAMAEQMGGSVGGGAVEQAPYHVINNLHVFSSGSRGWSSDGQDEKHEAGGTTTYLGLLVVARLEGGTRGTL
jgi:hypothetical protein